MADSWQRQIRKSRRRNLRSLDVTSHETFGAARKLILVVFGTFARERPHHRGDFIGNNRSKCDAFWKLKDAIRSRHRALRYVRKHSARRITFVQLDIRL